MPVRFECQAGHGWSPESLLAAQAAGTERALWAAVLRLEERSGSTRSWLERSDVTRSGFTRYRLQRVRAGGSGPFRRGGSSLARPLSARQIRTLLESPGEAGIGPGPRRCRLP